MMWDALAVCNSFSISGIDASRYQNAILRCRHDGIENCHAQFNEDTAILFIKSRFLHRKHDDLFIEKVCYDPTIPSIFVIFSSVAFHDFGLLFLACGSYNLEINTI